LAITFPARRKTWHAGKPGGGGRALSISSASSAPALLTLISYSLFFDSDGQRLADARQYEKDMKFVWGQAVTIEQRVSTPAKLAYLLAGMALLLTTELGVLDATSRISMDIVRVNWLSRSRTWTESRLYYAFLWTTIGVGTLILILARDRFQQFFLFKLTASLNGGVMFLYCMTLLALNRKALPAAIRLRGVRVAVMVWAVLFFGFFALLAMAALAGVDLSRWWPGGVTPVELPR
jgi:hypothetical protein